MKRILFFLLLIVGCEKDEINVAQIRIVNASDFTFDRINFLPTSTLPTEDILRFDLDLKKGESTEYRTYRNIFNNPGVNVIINDKQFLLMPASSLNAPLLKAGKYTFKVDVDTTMGEFNAITSNWIRE